MQPDCSWYMYMVVNTIRIASQVSRITRVSLQLDFYSNCN